MRNVEKPQFVVDAKGRKTGVLLDLSSYRQLLEDLHDLRVVAERKRNPKISFTDLTTRLRRNARL